MNPNSKHGNRWTQQTILEAIHQYTLQHGRRPSAHEWKQAGPWPSYGAVRRHFGTWALAMNAAGFKSQQGHYITSRHRKRGNYKTKKGGTAPPLFLAPIDQSACPSPNSLDGLNQQVYPTCQTRSPNHKERHETLPNLPPRPHGLVAALHLHHHPPVPPQRIRETTTRQMETKTTPRKRRTSVTATELQITPDWWIIADTHFGHHNIIRFCDRPPDHETLMVKKWTDLVQPDDHVLHLGDLAYKGRFKWGLPGTKCLLIGNHDNKTKTWYQERGFTVLEGTELTPYQSRTGLDKFKHGFYWDAPDDRKVLFSHFPDQDAMGWDINIHGHLHNNGYHETIDTTKNYVNVSVEMTDYQPVRLSELLERETK